MEKLKEYCGVLGIVCDDFNFNIAGQMYSGLMALQHRGQIFSGISTSTCDTKIFTYKKRGIVSKVLRPNILKKFPGNSGIGHVSCGPKYVFTQEEAQPFHLDSEIVNFSISMNGTINNTKTIHQKLSNLGKIFVGKSDIELVATLIETIYHMNNDMLKTIKQTIDIIKGAYSIIILSDNGHLYGFKDDHGYRPLCYGSVERNHKKFYVIASESCALDALGINLCGEISSGEILHINPVQGLEKIKYKTMESQKFCIFEYIYFARPDSIINDISVFDVRYLLGVNLAREDKQIFNHKNAIVVPVPDSGRSAAMGYAWESHLPYQEGLIKNRYIWQLKSDPEQKLNTIKSVLKDKDVILVDDSILSGKTMKKIIRMLKNANAKSIHVRISSPPVRFNCKTNERYLERDILIADPEISGTEEYPLFVKKVLSYIGADSLKYQTIKGLLNSIGEMSNNVCLKCIYHKSLKKKKDLPKLNSFL
ncbi:MAG: amidophosphoribosyltransferase [Candidatus Lokiarchaeota archaeon]